MEEVEIRHLPTEVQPGSREHALFLFTGGWLSRYGETAENLISGLSRLFLPQFDLFDPLEEPKEEDFWKLVPLLPFTSSRPQQLELWPKDRPKESKNNGIKEAETRLVGWRYNRRLLRDQYGSDPRNIFYQTARNRRSLIDALCQFQGIGEKIAQLIICWFQQTDWQEEPEQWQEINQIAVMPVDHWLVRLIRQFDLVDSWATIYKDPLQIEASRQISELIQNNSKIFTDPRHTSPHLNITQGLWHIGAKICNFKPKTNLAERFEYCRSLCPAHEFCYYFVPTGGFRERGTVGWNDAIPRTIDVGQTTIPL
jgi:hypothetical protein